MNDREIMEAAIRHMADPLPDPDEKKSPWRQLWDNFRLKFSFGKKESSVNASSRFKF